ncbi:auxin-responsive protein [bacterium]|nr:auxin-responsive protein [bacterium]
MGLFSAIAQAWTVQRAIRDIARYDRATRAPLKTQHQFLFDQLQRERETAFGRDHRFADIRNLSDFRRQVPVQRYEDLEPYIERVKQGETSALFHQQRVRMFALTSGTTQSRKFIPVTDRVLDNYRRIWTAWGLLAYQPNPALFRHGRLTFVSDWDEFRTPTDIPCGSISGYTAHLQNWVVRKGYVLPPESGKLHATEARRYLAWRLGLGRKIGSWMSPNPSTLVQLARYGSEHVEELLRDLHDGTLTSRFDWPEALRQVLRTALKPQPQRAKVLSQLVERTGQLLPRDVWPELQLLGCWTGGSMQSYLRSFPEYFGEIRIRDLGLIASEGRMTFPVADRTPAGVLEIVSGYYEFIPVDEIDAQQPTVLEAHELQAGRDYYILLTNASGLYRYHISDVVRCTGWHHATPLLEFLNKGSSISNITGEKLTEHQVVQSLTRTLAQAGRTIDTYSLAPCWDESAPYYGLFVEEPQPGEAAWPEDFAEQLDRQLCDANIEYASKRSSARLGRVVLKGLPTGYWAAWDQQRRAQRGGSVEQYKHPCLITDMEFHRQISENVQAAVR